ncbi:MAG: monofunctional biosynthetic peptidoglycan transglycosylase [candidate division KSB1 bacterium]|nr:monofunctional biosynthetic peptidoglycan transglycosylase [candidate division KSB1 bacterium]
MIETSSDILLPQKRPLFKRLLRAGLVFLAVTLLLPLLTILLLRFLPVPTTSFMMQKRIAFWRGKSKTSVIYRWTRWEEIPRHAALAVVAAEDQKFPYHRGFDWEGIAEAQERNRRGKRLRGGSTITQQTAKNLFLWPKKSYIRKALEAYFTVLLETLWPKQRILHVYLNIAEFGDGIYGIGAAADRLFKKPPRELTRHEAALLAAVLPSPKRLHADRPSPYVRERAEWILGQMEMLGDNYLDFNPTSSRQRRNRPHR